nr:N-6 DNA methylase [Kitasatospora purpeofusca]
MHNSLPKPVIGGRHYRAAGNRDEAAYAIAQAAASAWHSERGGNRIEIPIGVVASLAVLPFKGEQAPRYADWVMGLSAEALAGVYRKTWTRWWVLRPDLATRARPLHDWLQDDDEAARYANAVRAVTHAALKAGVLDLVGDADPYFRSDTDLLGWVVALMRSGGEQRALAEFPTPPDMAALMARLITVDMDAVVPGQSFLEPTSGTGAMVRLMAQRLREHGRSPADHHWVLNELDPLAAAVAAANAILWDLGPNTLVWAGDTLMEGDGPEQAAREKEELIAHRDRLLGHASAIAAVRTLDAAMAG